MTILFIGTDTKWGKVACVMNRGRDGERYYMMLDKDKCVSLMPACVVEGERE